MSNDTNPYLSIEDLKVHFKTEDGIVKAVDGVSYTVSEGETLGVVGESGSGKSVTGMALLGLHDPKRANISGKIFVDGTDILSLNEEKQRRMRGQKVSMIFQDALTALHPYYSIGKQIVEAYRLHHDVSKATAKKRAIEMLDRVGIPQPDKRFSQYPHEFSGGMRQRAMIAMSLVNNPRLIIADEPTTALDVTVQGQILDLLADLQKEFNSAIIMITHDLGVISDIADRIVVMYGGKVVETGTALNVMAQPQHPYTWGLLNSVPTLKGDAGEDLKPIPGNPPSLLNVPSGCAFHPRCVYALGPQTACEVEVPKLLGISGEPEHESACHLPEATRRRIMESEVRKVEAV
ncbi:ABC transporter ATP-binding protein [Stackebrandtia nassauensis]|uniref:Oligopeptide/dipeptide ABC transporter, ATPase subunit n=1 Tax=Stackebrandtia nassauensis (strain DSM 44728 / CIP 108903 / NRRL B-16338 / NBRC 102104 / LLR-40K-21) TaxID=446470 RepID=D3PW19_STANL|nr:ABC transporter ATP-binding protein [Stackebrandtia nassauensis]ADD45140.1 oligopeptide/dipeptide ABC transporter, ATPase subunit [Stackebrandtia nassauensis DSM 44728]